MEREEKITSLESFIGEINSLNEANKDKVNFLCYRGHSSKVEVLKPNIYRYRESKTLEFEDIMFKELLKERSDDFAKDKSTFDKLIRMQHYDLPTRLLDLTENPLVALYFACCVPVRPEESWENDGEVVVFSIPNDTVKYDDSDKVLILSNLCWLNIKEKEKICSSLDQSIQEFNEKTSGRLISKIRQDKSAFLSEINPKDISEIVPVKSKKNNDRIKIQEGLFLLFGMEKDTSCPKIEANKKWIEKKIIIEGKKKPSIIEHLKHINISKDKLFPGLESSAKKIKEFYERQQI